MRDMLDKLPRITSGKERCGTRRWLLETAWGTGVFFLLFGCQRAKHPANDGAWALVDIDSVRSGFGHSPAIFFTGRALPQTL
jgi:hypothetical protein